MRIAAGVLLIIAAVFNGCEGAAYSFVGTVASGAGDFADEMNKAAEEAGGTTSAEAAEAAEAISSGGTMYMIYGLFLLLVFGLQIGAGVVLFMQKAKGFVIVTAVLSIIAGGLSFYTTSTLPGGSFFSITGVLGILAAIFAFLGAGQYEEGAA